MTVISFLLITSILFALGAAVGSFLNVIIYRSAIGESWISGRSRCESCFRNIHWYDNIPLLSYLALRAKCRHCKEPIALSNPVIEFLTGTLFVWWYWGGSLFFQLTRTPFQTLQPLFWLLIGVLLVIVLVADILYLLIPDIAVVLLLFLTVSYRLALTVFGIMQPSDLFNSLLGMTLVFGFFGAIWFLSKGKGMGLGDVKLVVPLALLMGWPKMLVGIFLSFIIGAIVGILLMALKKKKLDQAIPFGPFLVIGTVLSLLIGDKLFYWYLSLL